MSHIFISYNSSNIDFAENLKHKIEQVGVSAWMDIERLHGGVAWRAEIDQAIRTSFALVLVLTPEALHSTYVNYEWAFALGAEVTVIPILLKPLSGPHPRLDALQHLDFTDRRIRPWDKLIEQLKSVTDIPPTPQITRISQKVPADMRPAIDALKSHRAEDRLAAIESLAQANHPAAREVLAEAVKTSSYPDVRIHAAFMLAQFQDIRALSGLREALDNNKNYLIGESLADALKDIEIFRKILQGFEIVVDHCRFLAERPLRYATVIALGEIPDSNVVTDLLKTLQDSNDGVRRISAFILGNIGDTEAVPGLLQALHDKEDGVREVVVMALRKIGTPATKGLIKALQNESSQVRIAATKALGEIADPIAIPALINIMTNDTDNFVRNAAVLVLGQIRAIEAIPELIKALPNQYIENNAEIALRQIGTPEALAAVNEWQLSAVIPPPPVSSVDYHPYENKFSQRKPSSKG